MFRGWTLPCWASLLATSDLVCGLAVVAWMAEDLSVVGVVGAAFSDRDDVVGYQGVTGGVLMGAPGAAEPPLGENGPPGSGGEGSAGA